MLSEGWDAKTVTHIMGLRAFSSQLLCEQVVGRGLRRTSYEVDQGNGAVRAGVRQHLWRAVHLPAARRGRWPAAASPATKTQIEPVAEKRQFEISWPNVIRIDHVYTPVLKLDLDQVPVLDIDARQTATLAELAPDHRGQARRDPVDGNRPGRVGPQVPHAEDRLRDRRRDVRPDEALLEGQPGVSAGAARWLGREISAVESCPDLAAAVLPGRLAPADHSHAQHDHVVQHIWEAIRQENTEKLVPVFDSEFPIRTTGDMRPWYTGRPCEWAKRSHVNFSVYDSTWEASEAFTLDHDPGVEAWVKNDHLGFEVLYVFKGVVRKYRPDFLIRLANGKMLVLEVKGEDNQQNETKRRFLDEWCRAVNEQGGFGTWVWDVSRHPADVKDILTRHADQSQIPARRAT